MNKVHGKTKSVKKILKDSKFSLDYYQREYRWETDQVTQLLDDLSNEFSAHYHPDHTRGQGKEYGHYFLGSIIIDNKGGESFIIDGQQRLTSLTLLLIYIHHTLENNEDKNEISPLIFSSKRGAKSLNIDVEERNEFIESLLEGKDPDTFDIEGKPKSIANIRDRYKDIDKHFSEKALTGKALLHFADWLILNVDIVQITTSSAEDAYTIFETMNDRGLPLTPTEMLKGYLLSRITDNGQRENAAKAWREQIIILQEIRKKEPKEEADADAIKAWLRSQYAQPHKGTEPRDFDKIGSGFHRWVRDKVRKKELDGFDPEKKDSFFNFITHDFRFYGKWYKFIRKVAVDFNLARKENVETIHYNFHIWHALWYMLLLAPLNEPEKKNDEDNKRKLQIVSSFLDILIARRLWNGNGKGKNVSSNTMRDMIIRLTQEIRGKSISELITILTRELDKTGKTFESNETLALDGQNRPHIRYLLARMTDYVQTQSGSTSRYDDYINYEVEHIWADQYEEHGHHENDEFENEHEFRAYRNRIGGLLLLPKRVNSGLKDTPYKDENASLKNKPDDKLSVYVEQSDNPLAYSLHERAYKPGVGKSGFQQFIARSKLEFEPHPEFKKKDLDKRQKLYRALCKQIWNPENLRKPLKNL